LWAHQQFGSSLRHCGFNLPLCIWSPYKLIQNSPELMPKLQPAAVRTIHKTIQIPRPR